MRIKKWAALLLGLVLAAGLLTGCSGGDGEGGLPAFTANTLEGGTFTQDDIAAKDVTIVNFWGTFCGPCLMEMPDLAAYAKFLPDNVQLITICVDGIGNEESAREILRSAGFEGITLLDGDEAFRAFAGVVQAVPTTVFLNSRGEQVEQNTILGAQADLAASFTAGVNRVLRADGKAEIQLAGE